MNARLQALRKMLKLSQKDFGEKLGVSRDVINNAELGRVDMKPIFVSHLCSTFNVNETWLRTGEGEPFKPVPLNEEIRQYFVPLENLSDEFTTAFADALAELQPEDWEKILDIVKDMKRKADERRAAREKEDVTILQAAHQRTDIEIPEGVDTSDDEFFD